MTREDYPCRQGLTATQRQEFYDWAATNYGYAECRYCRFDTCTDPWGHVNREIAWNIYAALRDSVNPWRNMPMPSCEALEGFYGHDYE